MEEKLFLPSIELIRGNITAQPDIEAVVNAANAALLPGGGVAGAIHRAAGPELADECSALAPISPGEAVITKAYGLPNRWVIHCLGPVYGVDEPADVLLGNCYGNALRIADSEGIASVAFPSISTGAFGYPVKEAAGVAAGAVTEAAALLGNVKKIRFVLFSDMDLDAYREAFGVFK